MRKIICAVVLLVSFSTFGQTTLIPDPNFEQALIDLGYDNVLDGQVLTNNISSIVNLNISFKNINDLVIRLQLLLTNYHIRFFYFI